MIRYDRTPYMIRYDNGKTAFMDDAQVRAILMPDVPMDNRLIRKRVRKNFPDHGGMFDGTIASYE